jgi:hypothetical protein
MLCFARLLIGAGPMRFKTIYDEQTIPEEDLEIEVEEPRQVLIVSGSMYFKGTDGLARVDISVHEEEMGAKKLGFVSIYQNGAPRHLAFPTVLVALALDAGTKGPRTYTLKFAPTPGTASDSADQFNVHLLQFTP